MTMEPVNVKGVTLEMYCILCEQDFTYRMVRVELYSMDDLNGVLEYVVQKHLGDFYA